MRATSLLMLMLSTSLLVVGRVVRRSTDDGCQQLRVGITVSSLITTTIPRQLELSWAYASPSPGDWIGLFNVDPSMAQILSPVASTEPQTESGWFSTNVQEPAVESSNLSFQQQCMGHWVAYVRNNTILTSSCLKTQPTWMADMQTDLTPFKLREIFLPGTHDSGAYKKYEPGAVETIITKYSITQEEDILSQLVHGVRYLDIRVGYYSSTAELWWANHGVVRLYPLKDVLDHVRMFLTNTNEIVILDVQEFPSGFGSGNIIHNKLVDYLEAQLGDVMASPALTWNTTIGAIWSSGKRLIVSYDKEDIVASSTIMWPAVMQLWGNVQTLDALYKYLSLLADHAARQISISPKAVMAELTPTAWQVIIDQLGGLRRMADTVNKNVTVWYWGEWGRTVNVVAVDFFKSTSIVEAAIAWNKHRVHNITCPP